MKKLIIVLSLFVLVSCGSKKETTSKKVIGLDDAFAPMGFKENGKIVGFDIDLAKAVGEKLNIEFEFTAVDWNSVVLELDSKKIDLIWNGMTITEERKKKMAISQPYFEGAQGVYVLKDSKIKTVDDLKSKKVGLQLGSTAEVTFNKEAISKETEITKYQDNTQAFLDLKIGRTDAVVASSTFGDYYLNKNEGYVKLDTKFNIQGVGVGARFEDQKLIDDIDATIAELKANGEYQKIYDKWFKNVSK